MLFLIPSLRRWFSFRPPLSMALQQSCQALAYGLASFPVFPAPAFFAAVEKNGAGEPERKHHVMSSTTYVTPKTTQSLT